MDAAAQNRMNTFNEPPRDWVNVLRWKLAMQESEKMDAVIEPAVISGAFINELCLIQEGYSVFPSLPYYRLK